MRAIVSSGVVPTGSLPIDARRSRMSAALRAFATSTDRRFTMGAGVPAGAAMLIQIVSAKFGGGMLNDQYGVANQWLVDWGVVAQKIAFTAEPAYALWTVVAVDVWKTVPFMALLCLAALQTLPKDIYEAARVDGIHPLRVFWRITLPLIKLPLLVAVVFRLLDALRIFDLIFVLTSNSTPTC